MSRLNSSDYENVLDLIESTYMAPSVAGVSRLRCTPRCGHQSTDILASLRQNFPSNTMSDAQVMDLLARGARSGVFVKYCSAAITNNTSSNIDSNNFDSLIGVDNNGIGDISFCDPNGVGQPLYRVNNNMVRVNKANQIYASAFGFVSPTAQPIDECNNSGGGLNSAIGNAGVGFYNSAVTSNWNSC
jgi:hypothetical protein